MGVVGVVGAEFEGGDAVVAEVVVAAVDAYGLG